MAPDRDIGSLSLDDVKSRFADAEEQLRQLAAATSGLQEESAALGDARAAVRDVGERVGGLADLLAGLADAMKGATEAVEQLDPAAISGQLRGLEEGIEGLRDDVGKVKEAQHEAAVATERLRSDLGEAKVALTVAVGRLRTLAFAGLGIGVVTTVLLILLLVR